MAIANPTPSDLQLGPQRTGRIGKKIELPILENFGLDSQIGPTYLGFWNVAAFFSGGVFFFILVSNLIGLLPLPFGEHHQPAFYAATANLNVTLMLALFTFLFTHYAGIRKNGAWHYVKAWAPPGAPPVLKQMIWFIHLISEFFRLISLSVRLFANMVAGHAILAVFFAMALIFQSYLVGLALQGASVLIYMFELFVAFIQAFIFAILSAVYIGGALDQDH